MEYLIIAVAVVAAIVALSTVSDRLGIAPPLILMLVGVGISLLPMVHIGALDPQWILAIILPPLLYSAAISIPTVELRRDFSAVGGLAVILVVISAVVLGVVMHWLIPGVSLALGIALGAILSPTDAAATAIVKRLGVPGRVGTILQGESLLNDATALVLLRSAIAAAAATVSLWHVVSEFLWAVVAAVVIGVVVGWAGVRLRRLVHNPAPATAISILVPFVAYLPAERVDASGLVCVVAAGIVSAQLGPRHLDARQRISERENWRTLEFLLEGAVFFGMGLELSTLVTDVVDSGETIWFAVGTAGLAILITLVVRGGYLSLLLLGTHASTTRKVARTQRWKKLRNSPVSEHRAEMRTRFDQADPALQARIESRLALLRQRVTRFIADVDYLIRQPLGWKEGTVLTWAGMRGVVTLAAAQTLPLTTPHRSLLILIAFFVAAGSLVIQGGTLSWLIKGLSLAGQDTTPAGEWELLQDQLNQAGQAWEPDQGANLSDEDMALARIRAQRSALLDLRSAGAYSSHCLASALAGLDAKEVEIQIRRSMDS